MFFISNLCLINLSTFQSTPFKFQATPYGVATPSLEKHCSNESDSLVKCEQCGLLPGFLSYCFPVSDLRNVVTHQTLHLTVSFLKFFFFF